MAEARSSAEAASPAEFDKQLKVLVPALLDAYAVPGAAVGIITDGKITGAVGYGYRDAQSRSPVTTRTAFNVGSISKTVTAWGVMHLVEEGHIALDSPVNPLLSRWEIPPSEFDRDGVTIRRLLNHTAGLSMWAVPEVTPDKRVPSLEEMLTASTEGARDVRLVYAPGSRWQYSGGGYAVLQLLIEEVTRQRFADYMEASVLNPLGMKGSSFLWDSKTQRAAASPHDGAGKRFAGQRFTATSAAGLQTTLDDMIKFALASLGVGAAAERGHPLRRDTISSMQAPSDASPDYGLGYELPQMGGLRFIGHSGQNEGWMAQVTLSPGTKDGIVILTNGTNGLRIISEIQCAWLLQQFKTGCAGVSALPVDVPQIELQKYVGRYRDPSGATARLTVHDGQLFWQTDYGYEFALRARSPDEFYWVVGESRLAVRRNERYQVTGVTRLRATDATLFEKID